MVAVSETMAVPGAHLQLRGHQQTAARGEQALPDHGEVMEKNHEAGQGNTTGRILSLYQTEHFSGEAKCPNLALLLANK